MRLMERMFQLRPNRKPEVAKRISNREEDAYLNLKAHGLSDTTSAAIMGNMRQEENAFNPYSVDSGALGMFQLKGVKRKAYQDYINEYDLEDSSANQIDFMVDTIYDNYKGKLPKGKDLVGRGNTRKIRKSFDEDDLAAQTKTFDDKWEISGGKELKERQSYAAEYLKSILGSY